jgi:hypothetical protein
MRLVQAGACKDAFVHCVVHVVAQCVGCSSVHVLCCVHAHWRRCAYRRGGSAEGVKRQKRALGDNTGDPESHLVLEDATGCDGDSSMPTRAASDCVVPVAVDIDDLSGASSGGSDDEAQRTLGKDLDAPPSKTQVT